MVDRVRDHNWFGNLRLATNHFNAHNSARGYIGGSPRLIRGKTKWRASITTNGEAKHLGYFDTEEEAKAAYSRAKINYLNQPSP